MVCVVMVGGDSVARACGMQVNCGILCGTKGAVNWAKDDGEEGRYKMSEEKSL